MLCTKCGKEIEDDACFCCYCGTPIPSEEPMEQDLLPVSQKQPEPQTMIESFSTLPTKSVPTKTHRNKIVKIIGIAVGVCILAGLLIAFFDSKTFYVYFKSDRKSFDSQSAMETYLSGEWAEIGLSYCDEYYVFTKDGLYEYDNYDFKNSDFWDQDDLPKKTMEDYINFPKTVQKYRIKYDYRQGLIKNADNNSIIFIVLKNGDLGLPYESSIKYIKTTDDASFPTENFRDMWNDICLYSEDLKHETTREVTQAATCKMEGVLQITCNKCHKTWTKEIPKEHNYDDNWRCITCGEKAPSSIEWRDKCEASEDLIIGCAKQQIESILKNPNSVIYNDAEVYEYDHYGRVIVYVDFSSENSFGGYVRDKWYVLFWDVTTDGHYNYKNIQWHCDANNYDLTLLKMIYSWDEKKTDTSSENDFD